MRAAARWKSPPGDAAGPASQPTQPVSLLHVGQARGATVVGGRAAWVTADDYPPVALRECAEGKVGIGVTIHADGHVAACEVTDTSGNVPLDLATCRTYACRGRFGSALDEEGRAVAARGLDRLRWRLPAR